MGTPCHTALGKTLCDEQHSICCYCEIDVGNGNYHIEHMEPRSKNNARTYDHTNLVLSCDGGTVEHCGRYKDDRGKNKNYSWDGTRFSPPHDPATARLFQYLHDGSISPTDCDHNKAAYMIGYLGLDCARLTDRRREHARSLIDTLGNQPDTALIDWLRQEHLHADGNGCLKQFHSLSKQILEP
jgi:uncharacterized protein (TIGR02646 family)